MKTQGKIQLNYKIYPMKIIKVTKLNAAATLKKYRFVEKLRPVDINEYKCVFVVLSGQMYFSVYYTQVKSIIQSKYMAMAA